MALNLSVIQLSWKPLNGTPPNFILGVAMLLVRLRLNFSNIPSNMFSAARYHHILYILRRGRLECITGYEFYQESHSRAGCRNP